jgi:hypothetical protein
MTAPIFNVPSLRLFVFLDDDGTYFARWVGGSTRGHDSATAALLFALELIS